MNVYASGCIHPGYNFIIFDAMIKNLLIISILWALLILVVCAIPGSSLPKTSLINIPYFDKWVHAGLYFPLAIILTAQFDISGNWVMKMMGPFFTLLILVVYGGLIEIAQDKLFVNRSADVADLLFDLFGSLFGVLVYYLFFRPWFKKISHRKH